MPTIDHVVLDVPDTAEAELFYKAAFGLDDLVRVQDAQEPSTGFSGITLSLVGSALEAGA